MSALDHLASLLNRSVGLGNKPLPSDDSIDRVIAQLEKQTEDKTVVPPEDLLRQAVGRFWEYGNFESFKDARSVSFGLCLPSGRGGPCIMDDRHRFFAVLDGLKEWNNSPRWYRRCYAGLVRSYFAYDPQKESASVVGRENWLTLRNYLRAHARDIVDKTGNPDWVEALIDHQQLFGEDPCRFYADAVLKGDTSTIDYLCRHLGEELKASWFMRELVLAQVRRATGFSDERFKALIPQLIALLSENPVLRDQGLILVLNRYAATAQPVLNQPLSDAAVGWWGNPWLPSNETRWGGVVPAARQMVSEWLKREFIEAFFTKLAEDGVGDRRRANFWLRYVKAMDNIQFALGVTARYSNDKDFVALRKKMGGLYTELKTTDSKNNAFVMTIGNLVAVEFGGMGNAFYGYDARQTLPFDSSRFGSSQPVFTTKNVKNSLKNDQRILWMSHKDGMSRWEEIFEAKLKQEFGITPNAVAKQTPVRIPTRSKSSGSTPQVQIMLRNGGGTFSMAALDSLARAKNLIVDDFRPKNGNLWVRADSSDPYVNRILMDWNFHYIHGKGWWLEA